MLGPEPLILDGRQDFIDAQEAFAGVSVPLGFFTVGWYGSTISDERGSFGVVDPEMGLADLVGDIVEVGYGTRRVRVYVIGSQPGLGTDLAITRRSYLAISLLAVEPLSVSVGVVQ
jgi:hypothetical protein